MQNRRITVTAVDQVPNPRSLPAQEVERLLPRCQAAIITATTFINGSFDHLVVLSRHCREVALPGPSTPLLPEVFAGTPATCLAGIMVQPDGVPQTISAGRGFRVLKRDVRKVHLRIAKP